MPLAPSGKQDVMSVIPTNAYSDSSEWTKPGTLPKRLQNPCPTMAACGTLVRSSCPPLYPPGLVFAFGPAVVIGRPENPVLHSTF